MLTSQPNFSNNVFTSSYSQNRFSNRRSYNNLSNSFVTFPRYQSKRTSMSDSMVKAPCSSIDAYRLRTHVTFTAIWVQLAQGLEYLNDHQMNTAQTTIRDSEIGTRTSPRNAIVTTRYFNCCISRREVERTGSKWVFCYRYHVRKIVWKRRQKP